MKTKIGTLRRLIRETYRSRMSYVPSSPEPYKGELTLSAIPDVFSVESPDMENMSAGEVYQLVNDMKEQIKIIRSVISRAQSNKSPAPGELGVTRGPDKSGTLEGTPELMKFKEMVKPVEAEYSRRLREVEKAKKRDEEKHLASLSPEELRKHREMMSVYGGEENYRAGRGLGT